MGSGLCPDTCLPRRPGLCWVFGERASPLPPAPHNPHVSKGGRDVVVRPRGALGGWVGGGEPVRSRGGAEAPVLADPQEASAADLVWDTGSGCLGSRREPSRLSWLPGQVEGDLELNPHPNAWGGLPGCS